MKHWGVLERRVFAVTLLVALAVRVLHWESMRAQPWFDYLGLDAKYYDEWAQRILREGLQGKDPYFMGPLYPHVLAVLYAVFGRSLDAVRAFQIGMSVATVGLLHLLARRFGGPALAMIASGALAVYGPVIYSSTSILFDATFPELFAPLLLLALVEAARRRSIPWAAGAGVVLGLWALGRANILLFAPCAFAWLAASWGHPFDARLSRWREGLGGALALAAGIVICILPASIHNARTGDPTLLTTNGGLNLYIGNGPMASGGHETPVLEVKRPDGNVERIVADLHKDVECRAEAEQAVGHSMKYTEVSKFYADETWRFAREHPGTFLSRMVRKVYLFWSDYEIPQIEHFGYFRKYSWPLAGPVLGFGLVAPLGLVGAVLALRDARRWALPLLFLVSFSASVILFFVLDRYRMPIVPVLLLLAGWVVLEAVNAVRSARWTRAAAIVGAFGALALFFGANIYGIDEDKAVAQIVYRLGIVEDARGNYDAAIGHYTEALRLKPGYDRAHLNLAGDLARVGRVDEAMEEFRKAEEANPTYYRVPYNRGALFDELGRTADAEAAYRRAVELEPRYLLGRTALAEVLLVRGAADSARVEFEGVLRYDGRWQSEQNPVARARAARFLAYLDDAQSLRASRAGSCFFESETFRRAEVARLRGRGNEAIGHLRVYFEQGGTCAEAYRALGSVLVEHGEIPGAEDAFQRSVRADPRIAGAHRELGRIAAIRGDAKLALAEFERERERHPSDSSTLLEIAFVHERLRADSAEAARWFARFVEAGGDPSVIEARRRAWERAAQERPE